MGRPIHDTYEDRQRWYALMRLAETKAIMQRYAHIGCHAEEPQEVRSEVQEDTLAPSPAEEGVTTDE